MDRARLVDKPLASVQRFFLPVCIHISEIGSSSLTGSNGRDQGGANLVKAALDAFHHLNRRVSMKFEDVF